MTQVKFKGRRSSRFFAVQASYQQEHDQKSIHHIINEFVNYHMDDENHPIALRPDMELFRSIVKGSLAHQEAIDQHVGLILNDDWKINRIDSVMRALFRCACYEIHYDMSIPLPVIINEYIEVAKTFFSQNEVNFINVMLDNLSKQRVVPASPKEEKEPAE